MEDGLSPSAEEGRPGDNRDVHVGGEEQLWAWHYEGANGALKRPSQRFQLKWFPEKMKRVIGVISSEELGLDI